MQELGESEDSRTVWRLHRNGQTSQREVLPVQERPAGVLDLPLDVIAVPGSGVYVTDGEYTWHLASEDYLEVRPALRRHYPDEYL